MINYFSSVPLSLKFGETSLVLFYLKMFWCKISWPIIIAKQFLARDDPVHK